MNNSVTCPKCGGTGQINVPECKVPDSNKTVSKAIDDNSA